MNTAMVRLSEAASLPGYITARRDYLGGVQYTFQFANGYGASVVNNYFSYGGNEGLWELAVIKFTGANEGDICYDTPITDDVVGWCYEDKIQTLLQKIEALPPHAEKE